MSENDHTSSSADQTLKAEKRDGVYLLEIRNEFEGVSVHSAIDSVLATGVTINGNYVGLGDRFETECHDFDITDDGIVDLRYDDTEATSESENDSDSNSPWSDRPECPECGSNKSVDYLSYPDVPPFANTSSGAYESVRKRKCWMCGYRWRASEDDADWSMYTDTEQEQST